MLRVNQQCWWGLKDNKDDDQQASFAVKVAQVTIVKPAAEFREEDCLLCATFLALNC